MYAGMAAVRTGQTSAYLQGNFGTSAPPRVAYYLTRAFARPVLRPATQRQPQAPVPQKVSAPSWNPIMIL